MNELTLPAWATFPAALLLFSGGALALTGSIGLLRMRTFFDRMHPPTMGTTLGLGCVLIASMLVSSARADRPIVHEIVITLFVFITSPVSAMTLMRAAFHRTRAHSDDLMK